MRAVKNECSHFPIQSNFERVFCVEKFRGLQFRGCEKDIFGKKKQKTEQGKGKVLY